MTYGAQNVDLRSILTTMLRWGILLAIQCFFPILCIYHSSRDNGNFPKQCLVFPKFWVFGPWGAQFWLNSKMVSVFLVDLVTPNQMPFTVCFYVASFSRSLGGGYPPPPPAGSKLAQTPAGARVIHNDTIITVQQASKFVDLTWFENVISPHMQMHITQAFDIWHGLYPGYLYGLLHAL